ncbi:MAG TPA: LysM peptidoglycan-binding domain-containing protein [Candidatus Saccharimonadales bacterium]|nr:LysM peptidoglycan-binding domain-containing protein [Candidatus Saccharimonadales bacterium]
MLARLQAGHRLGGRKRARRLIKRLLASKRLVRTAIIGMNVLLLAGVSLFLLRGAGGQVLQSQAITSSSPESSGAPLDQLSAADAAANVALAAALPETSGVINQAQSVRAGLINSSADIAVVAKPQAVATTFASNKDIKTYVVAPGDTVASIAAKFNVTSDSIMWSNSLSGNNVNAGTSLLIPPINGIVYTVGKNDTVDSLASKFRANKDQIIQVNDIELSGLQVGERILVPNGQQPVVVTFAALTAIYGPYNGYDYGFCTWYVANRRAAAGNPVPSDLGNANTWAVLAASFGIPTGPSPQVGAVAVKHSAAPGHVAYVEMVNADGSFWVSEMNSYGQVSMTNSTPTGGWRVIDWKLIPVDQTGGYTFIY